MIENRPQIDPKIDPKSTPNRPKVAPRSAQVPEGRSGHDFGRVLVFFWAPQNRRVPPTDPKMTPKIEDPGKMRVAGAARDGQKNMNVAHFRLFRFGARVGYNFQRFGMPRGGILGPFWVPKRMFFSLKKMYGKFDIFFREFSSFFRDFSGCIYCICFMFFN